MTITTFREHSETVYLTSIFKSMIKNQNIYNSSQIDVTIRTNAAALQINAFNEIDTSNAQNGATFERYFVKIAKRTATNENMDDDEETSAILASFGLSEVGISEDLRDAYIGLNMSTPPIQIRGRHGNYYDKPWTPQTRGDDCRRNVTLTKFGLDLTDENMMFFLEMSGRGHLTARQACSVESAARFSKLPVKVLMFSDTLNLDANVTCHLYTELSQKVSFHSADLDMLFADTPLENLHKSGNISRSPHRATHLADAIRLVIAYKYGGFYSDLDTIVLQPLDTFINVIGETSGGDKLHNRRHNPNGEFHFTKGHSVPLSAMVRFAKKYTGRSRFEVGPMLITATIKAEFNVTSITDIQPSAKLTLLPPEVFYPVRAYEPVKLWPKWRKKFDSWKQLFHHSVMIHIYGSQTNSKLVTGDVTQEAYSLLGPHYCPLSYYGTDDF